MKRENIQKASHIVPRSQKMLSDPGRLLLHSLFSAVLSLQVQEEPGEADGVKAKSSVARRQMHFPRLEGMTLVLLKFRGCLACELPKIQKSYSVSFRRESSSFPSNFPI